MIVRRIERHPTVWFAAALIVLGFSALVSFWNAHALTRSSSGVIETRAVLGLLAETLLTLADAETGQRGYLLTGDEAYLQPYREAVARADQLIGQLDQTKANRPDDQTQIAGLRRVVAEKFGELDRTIELRRTGGLAAALPVVIEGRGRRAMEEVRRRIAMLEREEQRLLKQREEARSAGVRRATLSLVGSTLLVAALLAAIHYLLRRDIRERGRTDSERRELLRELEVGLAQRDAILSGMTEGIAVADLQGHVILMNPAACRLCDFADGTPVLAHHSVYSDWFDLAYPDGRAMPADEWPMSRVLRDESLNNFEARVRRRSTGRQWVGSFGGSLVKDRQGRPILAIVSMHDVTAQKRVEQELRRAKEAAESAGRAKDQFLAMLSHELRTPLTPVLLSATAHLGDPRTPPLFMATFEMIRRNVELEARLIDDLLDVMRIIRGKMPFHFEVVNAHALILQTLEICRSETLGKRLETVLDLGAERHHVKADPARLQQLFWNLVKNATKFTPEGGKLTVRTTNRDGRLIVEVADTGAGIDPDLLPRIFNAFEQGEDPRSRKLGGLGLGLAISRSVAEAHGGRLSAQSPGPGQGATFMFDLETVSPAEPPEYRPAYPDNGRAEHRSYRLLLVEDDATTLRIMARLLRDVGHQVTTANGFGTALAAASADFDLVISDIGLPDGSGLELMRRLREQFRLPGIALTGFGMDEDIEKSRAAGFIAHLTKPIDFAKLDAMIQTVGAGAVATGD